MSVIIAHMVHSVELLLDPRLDEHVRDEWDVLSDAGLPSQNRHTGESNRPHVTVCVAASIPPEIDDGVAAVFTPFPVRLGGLVVFGGATATLARLVVPSAALLDLHTGIHDAVSSASEVFGHLTPGAWTPHVTLARRLTAEQLGAAARILTPTLVDASGTAVSLRRWDGEAKREWIIA